MLANAYIDIPSAIWHRYNVTVMQRFEAAYVKCLKMFFGYARLDSATSMFFFYLGLPTIGTIISAVVVNLHLVERWRL